MTTTADLIFSEQAGHNFSTILNELKRSTLSIHNRLRSITADALFVKQVAEACQLPLIANERCGSWYINPETKAGSAYFKSTDGHTGVWNFSLRRLNFHLLDTIGRHDGCMIVDSTRRGKRMPDALSKTVPIWCSVLNRVLFPDLVEYHELYTPPQVVSSSEHAQIYSRIPQLVESLKELGIDTNALRKKISKPLRPIWVTPESPTDNSAAFENFHTIICCTASRRVSGTEVAEGGYIQGAGDDTENWAHGLTPPIFWSNSKLLFSTSEEELSEVIESLVSSSKTAPSPSTIALYIPPTDCLSISSISALQARQPDSESITILLSSTQTPKETWKTSPTSLHIGLGAHKIGSRNLRETLPFISEFIKSSLHQDRKIFIACESGKDFSVGVALALLCMFFDEEGKLSFDPAVLTKRIPKIDKAFIRKRLGWIMMALPDANPSRATLQSVNSFLMDRR